MTVERQPESNVGRTFRAARRVLRLEPKSNNEVPASEEALDIGHQRAFRPPAYTMKGLNKPVQIIDQHRELEPAE